MDHTDDKNTALTDDELDKVAGGAKLDPESSHPCRCNNRVVTEIHPHSVVRYMCKSCGGYIPSDQIK